MSAVDQRVIDGICFEKVTVRHWRAVDRDGGIALSKSTRDIEPGVWAEDLKARVEKWCKEGYHLEEWEQTWWASESEWRRIESGEER